MYGYIYKTINLTNCKIYIGQHKASRFDRTYLGSGIKLVNAVRKYGKIYFAKVLLQECNSKEELDNAEKYYIETYNATDDNVGYNIALGGSGVPLASITEQHRQHISEAKKGIKFNQETKDLMSRQRRGSKWLNNGIESRLVRKDNLSSYLYEGSPWKPGIVNRKQKALHTEETKAKISQALKGKKKSENAISKHRKALLAKKRHWYTNGVDNICIPEGERIPKGFYRGRTTPDEIRVKISQSCKGRTPWNKGKTS